MMLMLVVILVFPKTHRLSLAPVSLEEQERNAGLARGSIGTGDGPTTWAAPVLSDVWFAAHPATCASSHRGLSRRGVILELEAFVVAVRRRQCSSALSHARNRHIVLQYTNIMLVG